MCPSNFSDFGHFYSQKWPFWAQKTNFLTKDASSRPKWVEHWLNKVEHCPTHSGGSVWALRAPKKCHQGAPEASKLAVLAQKGHFLTIYASSRPKWVEHWLNKVEHRQTHSGGSVWALRAFKKCHRGALEASKMAVLAQNCVFLTIDTFSRPKWVELKLNKVEHCQTHSGGSVWALRVPK